MSALNMDVKTHHPLGRLQPSQDCMFKRLKQKNIALVFMTKCLVASSWQSCVSGNPCRRGWPASPGLPGGPAGSNRPGLWLGICPDCQAPVLSFVKQAGDVTVDYAGVK